MTIGMQLAKQKKSIYFNGIELLLLALHFLPKE
jgi:hypothetical protein